MMIDQIVQEFLLPRDKFIYGFANLKGLVNEPYSDYQFGISIGMHLDSEIVDAITNGPTLAYHAHYIAVNQELQCLSEKIADRMLYSGHETITIRPSVTTEELDGEYQKTLRTPLSHKMVATRAGLGWIGKTDLFISHEFGPRLRLVSILTKTPICTSKSPVDASLCGSCMICVDECPAAAASGQLWNVSVDRDEFFDAQKCRKQCREFGESRLKSDIRICGICVAVCPLG